ncbi:MAG: hypothetical protein COB23_05045 [Methylophaga sp.]|nr:MAG: hypothetical protein COB23_05045 [Methylophaga sp.]
MSSLDKHVIRKARPYRCAILVILTAIITYASQWFYIQQTTRYQQAIKTEQLNDDVRQLNTKNTELYNTLTHQEKSLAIQQATNQQLQEQLDKLQNNVISLKKELVFYQTINQGNNTSKLQIRELHLRANEMEPELFHYRLVITQGKKITRPLSGSLSLTLKGMQHDKEIQSDIGEHTLSLRHVQVIEGQIKLTDMFQPTNIVVILKQNKQTLTRTFDWQLGGY